MGMSGAYDLRLVILSFVIAVMAAYTALDLAGRVTAAHGRMRLGWLAGGAVVMGIGIWSMHFVGMLAFNLPIPVQYDIPLVLLSMLVTIIASGLALFVMSRSVLGLLQWLAGSTVMGIAIASMHYIGMAGMHTHAELSYRPVLVVLSIVIAIVASLVALGMAFRLRREQDGSRLRL